MGRRIETDLATGRLTMTLSKLIRVTEHLRTLDPELPMQTALTFLLIGQKPGISMKELGERTGLARSSISRNVVVLAQGRKPKLKPGPKFVEYQEDPEDRRNKVCRLTPVGRRFLSTLEALNE
jgi:DNA-binding MarR family transcriptional regulator